MITKRRGLRSTVMLSALTGAVALGGCSSSTAGHPQPAPGRSTAGSSSTSRPVPAPTPTQPTSPQSAPTPTSTATPPARAVLNQMLLRLSDFPAGWRPTANGNPPQTPAERQQDQAAAACFGVPHAFTEPAESVGSPFFYTTGATSISSTASSFADQRDVDADTSLYNDPTQFRRCEIPFAQHELEAVFPHAIVTDTLVTVLPNAGAGPVIGTYEFRIRFTLSGRSEALYSYTASIAGRLTEAQVIYHSTSPADPSLWNRVIEAVAHRIPT